MYSACILKSAREEDDAIFDLNADDEASPDFMELPPSIRMQIKRYVSASQFLVYDLVAFKNPAFSEGSEVRVVHLASVDAANGHWVELLAAGYPDMWRGRSPPVIDFAMRGSVPVCHVDFPFMPEAIKKIVIGPRAAVTDLALTRLLSSLGFPHVETIRSVATYR